MPLALALPQGGAYFYSFSSWFCVKAPNSRSYFVPSSSPAQVCKPGSARFVGMAGAVAVGLFFFKGTLRVPLHRFFAVTSVILMLVAFQLAITGLHELSEAQWLPSSKTEMAIIGPVVRNELFFFVLIFGAAALLVLREWQSAVK